MPMHDWTKVVSGVFHDFHQTWIIAIKEILNESLLPDGYYALAEQVAEGPIPDVLALEYAERGESGEPAAEPIAVADRQPKVMYTLEAGQQPYLDKANRVTVFHASGDRAVAYVEIVSPGNKHSEREIVRFLDKCAEAMQNGLHLLIVDPFPPTLRDPKGLHARFWTDYFGQFDSPGVTEELPLSLAAYCTGIVPTAYFNPINTSTPMPDMPLYLTPDYFVDVPLEDTYRKAYEGVPDRWKKVIENENSTS